MAPGFGLTQAQETLAAQPFSVLLGARIVAFGDGEAVVELDARDELRQQNGFLHGGVLAYAADNALTFAAGSVLGPAVLTGGFSLQYLRPATGPTLSARASVLHSGRRQAACRCELYAVDGAGAERLCAVAQGTVLTVQP
ncbi:PaaI family thioesterase [Streptomyces sp. CA-294286]|uniref:PaaI family thioesterase n=1 Tax=Streptomyces sp. CA-294286 TaxID=3240070 RepID=UPI003D93059A